ncbi:universal stress protein [Pararhizobium sp.]|uniref:universal stress protein n=1 Tax=Pararhizobium sp. TaxID=1977563 RepID=UPI002727B47C|nr:universal stress protein [Pararhizobium sp.]MDO9417295.1 universal stress protein [Pararhizobium sp.]
MFSKIVVPVAMDHLDRGEKSLSQAARLLEAGGEIILLNIVEDMMPYVQGYMVADFPLDMLETSRRVALERLTELKQNSGIDCRLEIRLGGAAGMICGFAQDEKADLVIIASHRPGLSDYFLGSTTERVARHCKCSVLVER